MQITIMLVLYYLSFYTVMVIQEADDSDFNDLGKLLFAGFILAVAAAIGLAFIKLRWRSKRRTRQFLSISESEE